jgi:hypothetical protein
MIKLNKIILTAIANLTIATSAHAATLQADTIFGTSEDNFDAAIRLCVKVPVDEAGLEEMGREFKINIFHCPVKVNKVHRGFMKVSLTFPSKTNVLWTATEEVTE